LPLTSLVSQIFIDSWMAIIWKLRKSYDSLIIKSLDLKIKTKTIVARGLKGLSAKKRYPGANPTTSECTTTMPALQ
jgi:hypothetical protein